VAACDVGVAIGREDRDAQRRRGRHDVAQHSERCRIGPVEIVEDDGQLLVVRHAREELDHGFEEEIALGIGIGVDNLADRDPIAYRR
jgi:hypothetical protein